MRELILDHGSEFGAHRIHKDDSWSSGFKDCLEKYRIKPILARAKHPQTNGKLEKWFDTYRRFRWDFGSFQEFIDRYTIGRTEVWISIDWRLQRRLSGVEYLPKLYLASVTDYLVCDNV